MSPTRWDRIADLFDRAADLPPEAQAAFLDAEASGDLALREEVEQLLAADTPEPFLVGGIAPSASLLAPPPEAGPWRLVERVGQGGMGEVWRAERDASGPGGFEQTAAVKLVRPGLGESIAARFRAERQTLARLEHPAIARLLGGGTASDGRPYLATEFVRGEPITAYADRQRLGVNARLALFQEVCEAVAYAHSRLVVHRDIKPSNVLVASGEGGTEGLGSGDWQKGNRSNSSQASGARGAHVKLLDFGIAKLLDASGDDLTRTGRPLLTPAYAAPEQASGDAITTATDVYGLGVLLYELLTGSRPAPGGDVTRPSEAVTASALTGGRVPLAPEAARSPEASGGTGALRSTTPERLRKRLRGDLDRIVLKALRADPERRYRGAAELGADIGRHLDGLPVEARPESTAYRIGKFVRRHRALVAVASVALLAVLAASGAALANGAEASRQRDAAQSEAARAESVAELLISVFERGEPGDGVSDTLTVRHALASGLAGLDALDAAPDVRAEALATIGSIYFRLGLTPEADSLLSLAVAEGREAFAPEDPRPVAALTALVDLRASEGAFESARPLADEAVARAVRSGDPRTMAQARMMRGRLTFRAQGEMHASDSTGLVDAEQAYRDVQRTDDSLFIAQIANDYAVLLSRADRTGDAITLTERALGIYRRHLAPTHTTLGSTLNTLAHHYHITDRTDEAVPLYREAIAIQREVRGRISFPYAAATNNLAGLLSENGREAESLPLYDEVLVVLGELFGEGSPYVASTHRSIGGAHSRLGNDVAAISAFRESVRTGTLAYGAHHAETYWARVELAQALRHENQCDDALSVLRAIRSVSTDDRMGWWSARARSVSGRCHLDEGRRARGRADLQSALRDMRAQEEPDTPWIEASMAALER